MGICNGCTKGWTLTMFSKEMMSRKLQAGECGAIALDESELSCICIACKRATGLMELRIDPHKTGRSQ